MSVEERLEGLEQKVRGLERTGRRWKAVTAGVSLLLMVLIPGALHGQMGSEPDSIHTASDSTSYHLSDSWHWTKDARGGGSQDLLSVKGDTLTIGPADHVHFTNLDTILDTGIYRFQFRTSTRFIFAWRVSPQNPQKGTGLIFQTERGRGLSLIHVDWNGFYYGWHNASSFRNTVEYSFSANDWHSVEIHDTGSLITVSLDGKVIPFFEGDAVPVDQFLADVGPGYVGIGGGENSTVQYLDVQFLALNPPDEPTFSISLDLDLSTGDQSVHSIYSLSPDSLVSIQIFVESIASAVGFGARFEYDDTQVTYEGFEVGDVLPNAQSPGAEQGSGPTYVEVTAATFDSTTADSGLLGVIRFRTTPGFTSTTISMVRSEIRRGGEFETSTRETSVTLALKPSPDFNGDGKVGFRDFLLFAERYGTKAGQPKYDSRFDLDQNGEIGFSDFVLFARSYGKPVS